MPDASVLTMKCVVINYGYGRKSFPTRVGNLFINRLVPFTTDDMGVVEDLRRFEYVNKLTFEFIEDKIAVDYYGKTPIWELRKAAAGLGIKGCFYMRKPEIIKLLEENNATSI